jgi:subtilisin family serine protease
MRKRWAGKPRLRSQLARWRVAARILPILLVAALLMQDVSLSRADQKTGANEDVVVVFPHRVETSALGVLTKFDIEPTQRYTTVVDGFAASVTPEVRQQLEQIPGAIVSPDRRVEAFDNNQTQANHQGKAKGDGKHATSEGKHKHKHKHKHKNKHKAKKKKKKKNSQPFQPQITPTGVLRIAATQNPQAGINGDGGDIDVDVAVLDTGIGPNPDLNIQSGLSCVGSGTSDADGHGTHVSGIIGAMDNNINTVGVAPGARLHPVKVLDNNGVGSYSTIICGLDWVLQNASTVDVVNMSLGGFSAGPTTCADDPLHLAVCNVVNAGIPVIVAAGNEGMDAANDFPANFDEVITVAAFSDYNGEPGGGAPPTCDVDDLDDSFASYSNFGPTVDIIAPGSCITSTWNNNGIQTISGTSMATPYVTGAAALFLASHPDATPAQVRAYLVGPTGSVSQGSPLGLVAGGDPSGSAEPVLYIPTAA